MHDTKLEKYLKHAAINNSDQFPFGNINYYELYKSMKNLLNNKVYGDINAMLSISGNVYTDHGKNHVDSVIRSAEMLLKERKCDLNGYEIFLLLSSILIHDVGNLYGREGHEKQGFEIINQHFPKMIDAIEGRIIAQIVGAHGGITSDGDKDTISKIQSKMSMGSISFRHQMIAGILRFADEISENNERCNSTVLEQEKPPQCVMHHKYASCIQGYIYEGDTLSIEYSLGKKDIMKRWQKGNKKRHLIDEILERIYKMDMERIYCSRFMSDIIKIRGIHARISIYTAERKIAEEFIVTKDSTEYPSNDIEAFKERYKKITSRKFKQQIQNIE